LGVHARDFGQLGLFIAGLILITPLLGRSMMRVFGGDQHLLARIFGPAERCIYRLSGINPAQEMTWRAYATAMLVFNVAGGLVPLVHPMMSSRS
jgi:K+-transporting ATPase ATPase A chain